jgi:hypothetical protein
MGWAAGTAHVDGFLHDPLSNPALAPSFASLLQYASLPATLLCHLPFVPVSKTVTEVYEVSEFFPVMFSKGWSSSRVQVFRRRIFPLNPVR